MTAIMTVNNQSPSLKEVESIFLKLQRILEDNKAQINE
jgi:hypothetical protein